MANILTYILLFLGLYFEVFFLVTYLEHQSSVREDSHPEPSRLPQQYPTVSIIVPCWNEETTLSKTVRSILALDYPADKLDILIVDDGSTDNTLAVARGFENISPALLATVTQDDLQKPRVRVFSKSNGGKHTALNFGLAQSTSELVGCLDADSYVDSAALKNIILYFEGQPDAMVVTPSIKIDQPKSIIQLIQSVEYSWAIFLRKMLAYMGALYVTPGPFSIFKREVFEQIGPYRHAYLTEDMELAMRMQSHHMKIVNCHTAFVLTAGPATFRKLYKQRLRWTYGFIKNVVDYRYMFFKKKYGNLGLFILPIAMLSILTTIYTAGSVVLHWIESFGQEIVRVRTIGLHIPQMTWGFDWFYINTEIIATTSVLALLGIIVILLISRTMAQDKKRVGLDLFYFLAIYSFIAPIWLAKALYNAVFSVTTTWR